MRCLASFALFAMGVSVEVLLDKPQASIMKKTDTMQAPIMRKQASKFVVDAGSTIANKLDAVEDDESLAMAADDHVEGLDLKAAAKVRLDNNDIFDAFDADSDGFLSRAELVHNAGLSSSDVDQIFRDIDAKVGDKLGRDEYLDYFNSLDKSPERAEPTASGSSRATKSKGLDVEVLSRDELLHNAGLSSSVVAKRPEERASPTESDSSLATDEQFTRMDEMQAKTQQQFDLVDANGDGFVTEDEAKNAIRRQNVSISSFDEAAFKDMFGKVDLKQDGVIDIEEYTQHTAVPSMPQHGQTRVVDNKEQTRQQFVSADADKDGFLSKYELKYSLMGERAKLPMNETNFDEMFDHIDHNKDSRLDFDEVAESQSQIPKSKPLPPGVRHNLAKGSKTQKGGKGGSEAHRQFKAADRNHDGFISKAELAEIVSAAMPMDGHLDSKGLDRIFKEMDSKNDNKLDVQEVSKFFEAHRQSSNAQRTEGQVSSRASIMQRTGESKGEKDTEHRDELSTIILASNPDQFAEQDHAGFISKAKVVNIITAAMPTETGDAKGLDRILEEIDSNKDNKFSFPDVAKFFDALGQASNAQRNGGQVASQPSMIQEKGEPQGEKDKEEMMHVHTAAVDADGVVSKDEPWTIILDYP